MKLFSQRQNPPLDIYEYEVPQAVRARILHTLKHYIEQSGCPTALGTVLQEVHQMLLQNYGYLREERSYGVKINGDPVIEHFGACNDEEVLDFLELCFRTHWNCGGQPTVDAINQIFEEENIGYELTSIVEIPIEGGARRFPGSPKRPAYRIQPPMVIRKDEKRLHQMAVQPALYALSDPRFATANAELVSAYDEYRHENYDDAVTDAGAAFESTLKTICTIKGWSYDKEKHTCSNLLDICRDKGLFHGFYRPILEGTATVRNKTGDAHGKGPKAQYPTTKEIADHMLNMVCNNINFVIAQAKL